MKRREFLKVMGVAMSGAASWRCNARRSRPLRASRKWLDYYESRRPSVCTQCSGGCGIIARVVNSRVVKIGGNALHPVNRGALCPAGQAGTQLLYHPSRFKTPLKRTGGKKSNQWMKIDWGEATHLLASNLKMLRDRGKPHSLVVLDGQPDDTGRAFFTKFCDVYGTPNYFPVQPNDSIRVANRLMHGVNRAFSCDLENSNYILSFSCDLLDAWRSSTHASRALAYLRQERPGARAKLVQLDRGFSTTASKADEWISIQPLTEGALALAIAQVIIREQLYDKEFIASNTTGFEEFAAITEKYKPEDVAETCGISAGQIIRIAREFAQSRPSAAVTDLHATSGRNGTATAIAVNCLNALVGNISIAQQLPTVGALRGAQARQRAASSDERPGGHRPPLQLYDRPSDRSEGFLPPVCANIENIPEVVVSRKPYPVETMLIHNIDPISTTRVGSHFRQALDSIPLVVSFATGPDRTSEAADLILPDPTFLEKWLGISGAPVFGNPVFSAAQPVVEPLYQTMQTEDFILRLAQAIGSDVAEAFPWQRFSDVLRFLAEGLYKSEGRIFGETVNSPNFDKFWESLIKKGGWQPAAANIDAPKFDFCTGVLAGTDFTGKPDGKYRFFIQLTGVDRIGSPGMNLPWVREIRGVTAEWESWAEINPRTASELNVANGDWIRIETSRGELRTRARTYRGAMPEILYIPADNPGVKEILELQYDHVSGEPAWFSTRANVNKA